MVEILKTPKHDLQKTSDFNLKPKL